MKDIIDKAVKGGYPEWMAKQLLALEKEELRDRFSIIIMTHQFLKAFFGEEYEAGSCPMDCASYCEGECSENVSWQNHARMLVLSTDRKEYLRRFV